MTDTPFRVYGPDALSALAAGSVLYTAPSGTNKMFIRDITLSNFHSSVVRVRMSIGSLADPSNRVVDQDIAANTAEFIRPLWLMDANETLEGLQVLSAGLAPTLAAVTSTSSGTDGTSLTGATFTRNANTTYLAIISSGVASGTTALTPSSVTGAAGETWTLITGSDATSTVAAAVNGSIAAYWMRTGDSPTALTTGVTANYASTQHSFSISTFTVANTYAGTLAIPGFTTSAVPYTQAASAGDSTAPASTTDSKAVTLGTLKTGIITYHHIRFNSNPSSTPQAGFTETSDTGLTDGSGSIASFSRVSDYVTTPPWANTTVGPDTLSLSSVFARCGLAIEWVPSGWVNCMVSGIEVR